MMIWCRGQLGGEECIYELGENHRGERLDGLDWRCRGFRLVSSSIIRSHLDSFSFGDTFLIP